MKNNISKTNIALTILSSFLSVLFITIMIVDPNFFEWTFARHQNMLSWYIRPLFLIPLCYYAYKHNPFGISLTVFLLLTSMFWFPEPSIVNNKVKEFLIMEKSYLTTNWTVSKALISLLVPLTLSLLARAFWKRSIRTGIIIIVIIAVAKTFWSIVEGGTSGQAVMIPATIGLVICIVVIYYGYKRFWKDKEK